MPPRRSQPGSRLAAFLVLLGCVAVLGGTFAAGFFVGRNWPRGRVVSGLAGPGVEARPGGEASAPSAAGSPAGDGDSRGAESARKPAETIPRLTFYQELTAPLAAPPPRRVNADAPKTPAGRSGEPGRASKAAPLRAPVPEAPGTATSGEPVKPLDTAATPSAGVRPTKVDRIEAKDPAFTVQVAALGTRAQAETLRQTLAARGIEADVSATETPSGTRYRVRAGTYATREEARAAAARLATDGLEGFVAAR